MKQNKTIVILCMMILLVLSFVNAADFEDRQKACWNWDGDATDDSANSYDGSVVGATNTVTYGGGLGGGAYHYVGGDDSIAVGAAKDFNYFGNDSSIICFNTSTTGTSMAVGISSDNAGQAGAIPYIVINEVWFSSDATNNVIQSTTTITDGRIICVGITHNTVGDSKLYINGILNDSGSVPTIDSTAQGFFGRNENGGTPAFYTGWIGISAYWENRTLSAADFTELETNMRGGAVCPQLSLAATPTVTINYPSDGDKLNDDTYEVNITGTVTILDSSPVNNTWINDTRFYNNGTNASFIFLLNGTLTTGVTYTLNVTANSSDGTQASDTVYFTYDTAAPTIVTTLEDNTTLKLSSDNLTFQVNITDNIQVYSFNVSTSGGFYYNISGLGGTEYIYNGSILLLNSSLGENEITFGYCDAHTSKELKQAWTPTKYGKTLDFDGLTIESTDQPSKITFTEHKDRYSFCFDYSTEKSSVSFILPPYLERIANPRYKGWYVDYTNKRWIDFEGEDKVTTNGNIITVTPDKPKKKFCFDSVGELNCDITRYKFYIYNYSLDYKQSIVELETSSFIFTIDYPDRNLNVTGTLYYNGTAYSPTNTSKTFQTNLTYSLLGGSFPENVSTVGLYWTYNINSTSYQSRDYNQTVNKLQITTCGGLTNVYTLNISIFDEDTPTTRLISDVDITMRAWTNNSANSINFTFDLNQANNYSLCIFPNTTINVDAYMVYNVSASQRWFLTSAPLTQSGSNVVLYNRPSLTGLEKLEGVLRDVSYKFFPLVITKLQRYYIAEDLWRTVQMDRSDDFGQIVFNIIEESTDYRLIFEKDNVELDRTNEMKFVCHPTTSICTLTFIVKEAAAITEDALTITSSYNNNTEIYTVTWSDTTGITQEIRVVVSQERGDKTINICDETVASSSGTITCDTSGYSGTLKATVFKTQSPEKPEILEYITKVFDRFWQFGSDAVNQNEVGLWAIGISSIFMMGGAITGGAVGAILTFVVSLFFISLFKLLTFVTAQYITLVALASITIGWLLRKK